MIRSPFGRSRRAAHLLALATVALLLAAAFPAAAAEEAPLEEGAPYLPWLGAVPALDAAAVTRTLPDGTTHEYWSWGVDVLGAPALWDQGYTGKGVKVAVVDTGIDVDHPYLKDHVAWGHNLCSSASSYDDDNGHGTHVAGIVKQMAPDVTLYAIKVLDAGGSGRGCDGSVEDAMLIGARGPDGVLGTSDDADIVQVSIGLLVPVGTPIAMFYRDPFVLASAAGVTFVAAAGNSYVSPGIDIPAAYPSVVAVAALGSTTGQRELVAEYSSNGITDRHDVRIGAGEVEVTAPGTGIVSAYNNGGRYTASGTSMAAPHVSGLLALREQAQPDTSTPDVRGQLRCSSEDLAANGKLTTPGYDVSSGYGLPDATRILAGPCHGPKGPTDVVLPESDDYDGDGRPDNQDPVNGLDEARVFANASDDVWIDGIGPGDTVALVAPDGRTMTVTGLWTVVEPFNVTFDGRVSGPGAGRVAVQGDLVGAPADGTWTVRASSSFQAIMETVVVHLQDRHFAYRGWSDGGPLVGAPTLWNWHVSDDVTIHTGSWTVPGTTPETSPQYARYYV